MRRLLRTPKLLIPIVVVTSAGLAWLAFGFFGVHLLFVDDVVDEAIPVFDASPVEAAAAPTTASPAPPPAPTATAAPADPPTTVPATTLPPPTAPPTPQIVTEYSGTFESRDHPTSGTALVLGNGTGQRFLRFEGFATDNGPDLNVYLVNSSAGGVTDVVDLGDLAGNIGDQNYEIPDGVDLGRYDTVVIWCVRFSSPFGEAALTPV